MIKYLVALSAFSICLCASSNQDDQELTEIKPQQNQSPNAVPTADLLAPPPRDELPPRPATASPRARKKPKTS